MDGDFNLVRTAWTVGAALGTSTSRLTVRGLVVGALLMAWFAPAQAQEAGEPLVVGHRYTLSSAILDRERPVRIGLPADYDASAAYPVVYVLDGETHFQHTLSSMRFLAAAGRMPQAILVAVENVGDDRTANLTPAAPGGVGGGGDADRFRAFLRDELKPWVDERYATRPFDLLIGHSFGGLFITHLLREEPRLFDAYISISPSLHWPRDGEYVATLDDLELEPGASLYMSAGGEGGGLLAGALRFAGVLENNAPAEFRWKWQHMPGESHGSVPGPSTYEGLQWTFEAFNPVHLWDDLATNGADALPRIEAHFDELSAFMGFRVDPPISTVGGIATRLGTLLDRNDDALAITQAMLSWRPDHPESHFRRAHALRSACRVDEARTHYARALELAPRAYGADAPMTRAMARGVANFERRQSLDPGSSPCR